MDREAREERLKLLQDVRVYPVGRVLRETFDADNHDSLGNDVTGLMINLSRVPFEPSADNGSIVSPLTSGRPRVRAADKQPGLLRRLGKWLRGR